jgi:hypothetical protein
MIFSDGLAAIGPYHRSEFARDILVRYRLSSTVA